MSYQLPVLIEKMYLGLLLAAPLGPVSLEMIRRGLTSGFWASYSVRLGGGLANLLCLALTCFGLSFVVEYTFFMNTLGFLGILLLFYLGISTLRSKHSLEQKENQQKETILSGLILGFYLGILNPIALAFWPGVFASTLKDIHHVGFSDFLENTFILWGILLWGAFLSFLSSLGKRYMSLSNLRIVAKGSGILILLYATKSLFSMISRFMF